MRYDRQWKIQDWGWKWQIFLNIWHAFVFDCKTVRLYTFRMELTVTKLPCLVWVGYFAIRGWSDSGFFSVFMCCMYGPYGRSWIEPGQLNSCDYSNSHGIILGLCRRKIMKNRVYMDTRFVKMRFRTLQAASTAPFRKQDGSKTSHAEQKQKPQLEMLE